jgi:hypothetical protein
MILVTLMKIALEVWVDTLKLRRDLAKRYPGVMAE